MTRSIERHSHDIYLDQVRWLNRIKLDFEEDYGAKVTSNAMVQLAIDLLRDDYEANGDRSDLVRVLVFGRLPRTREAAESSEEEGRP